MMPLHTTLDPVEYADDSYDRAGESRLDFLNGVPASAIARVDEVHASEMNDSEYVWLIWLTDEDAEQAHLATILGNVSRLRFSGWKGQADYNGTGFVVVRTFQ